MSDTVNPSQAGYGVLVEGSSMTVTAPASGSATVSINRSGTIVHSETISNGTALTLGPYNRDVNYGVTVTAASATITRQDAVLQVVGNAGYQGFQATPMYRWKPTGNRTVTFTAVLAAAATGGTLNANWAGISGLHVMTLSTGQTVLALLTNGATTCTFYANPTPAAGGSYGSAFAIPAAATATATVAGQPPLLGVANAYSVSASIASAGSAVLGGAQTTASVGTPDVPRNVVGAWTGTATATVTGTDYYGNVQTEVSASGTSLATKKSFATIAGIVMSASVTGATFGTGNVLGLPFRIISGDFVTASFNDAVDAGTVVISDITSPATSSTGDVRGTYTPAGSLNGAKYVIGLFKPADNATQFGALGVTPA